MSMKLGDVLFLMNERHRKFRDLKLADKWFEMLVRVGMLPVDAQTFIEALDAEIQTNYQATILQAIKAVNERADKVSKNVSFQKIMDQLVKEEGAGAAVKALVKAGAVDKGSISVDMDQMKDLLEKSGWNQQSATETAEPAPAPTFKGPAIPMSFLKSVSAQASKASVPVPARSEEVAV